MELGKQGIFYIVKGHQWVQLNIKRKWKFYYDGYNSQRVIWSHTLPLVEDVRDFINLEIYQENGNAFLYAHRYNVSGGYKNCYNTKLMLNCYKY